MLGLIRACHVVTHLLYFQGFIETDRQGHMWIDEFFFFFLIYVGCPGQLTRTTTIPHGPLDILQAQEQVRHRGGDRRAHRGSNPGRGRNKSHCWPQQLDPQVRIDEFLIEVVEQWEALAKLHMLHWLRVGEILAHWKVDIKILLHLIYSFIDAFRYFYM